ncbi:hypothetical protein AC579_7606 [Pseudocercospora musae]|uniref:Cytoplasmic tRNA 2-thiolation protein 1 n=1 Tax=Pseudocercospora musae TaxID=113226 RepID=A0A139IDL2_9PEZI|nr:hypothetical protein AC579_7606 [Pseudocercospora musae]
MEPYNPRQWSNRAQVSGSQMLFQQRHPTMPPSTSHITGMEADIRPSKDAMPSPPPPYSASPGTPDTGPRTVLRGSPIVDNASFTAAPMAESSLRNSPQITMSPAFPPPPAQSSRHRERSASGLGNRSLFSLSGLRGKQPANTEVQLPQPGHAVHVPSFVANRPPAARRAASTGHMQSAGSSTATTAPIGRASPDNHWQPGMPLPGPPPNPPQPGVRSQSLNRPIGGSSSSIVAPDRQLVPSGSRRTVAAPSLGPVPPTPAGWVEHDASSGEPEPPLPQQHFPRPAADYQPLRIHTGTSPQTASRENSLARRPAQRDTSYQGIRERRSRSRAAKGTLDEDDSKPANLIFDPVEGSISRRREHMRTASGFNSPSSASSLPPQQTRLAPNNTSNILTPPYTPAVGKQAGATAQKQIIKVPGSASSDRPISHILHTPNDDTTMPAPLSPARPASSGSAKVRQKLNTFALDAIKRHRAFVEQEIAASTDEERLELFANFMVHESRLRRDRYSTAYNAMAGDILDWTRDMWRSFGKESRRATTPSTTMSSIDPTVPAWTSESQPTSALGNEPSSASSLGDFTPATDASSMDFGDSFERNDARQWAESFKPSLSPIPSMAVSTVPDEDSSRGRQPSRWFEQSNSGGGSIGRPDRMEKTRRETKYMGINPADLQGLVLPTTELQTPTPGPSGDNGGLPDYSGIGPGQYPPEKIGWHESIDLDTPMQTPHRATEREASNPGVAPLNVSRLVTLPPPYPRHHPAVNNSHPLLTELRTQHRLLADHSEIQKIKDVYLDQDFALTREQQEGTKKRRTNLRMSIQNQIAEGTMSFADAAKAEVDFDIDEAERGKATARSNFDVFEAAVSHPLNALLTERLEKASSCITQLRYDLESGHESTDPNRAQVEGDEHPERLEKLTLLKWLFEAREQLHKEMFDLHAMRSEKYSEVILTPYRISKAQGKIEEATTFFKKDSIERQTTYAKESLKRYEQLQGLMEKNVSRGVEDQLSAFWDIAPGLLEVLQQIPRDMLGFEVHIPLQEYDENPSYHDHPLQYLYSLLGHAEKSAYQFIESQVNLLCLLHEVRTATTKSRLRLLELERATASPNSAVAMEEMAHAKREAEDHLTQDLKEKVGEVEKQWQEALGAGMSEVKDRVSAFLEETGGLEDGLIFEDEVAETVESSKLFQPGEKVAIGASGGKDSTVLASVLKTLNHRQNWGLDLILLSVDEGIQGYRDHSLEAVKRHAEQYQLPLQIVSYAELYGWSMDQVVAQVGKKGNCTYCGVFRRQALDRGAAMLNVGHVVTGHNADDVAETVLMNLLRGDLPRLSRATSIITSTPSAKATQTENGEVNFTNVKRSKPLMYAYEKEIVLYAHHKKLDYFSTECIYSPEAFRGSARTLIKNLERIRPESILDVVRSGIDMAKLVPDANGNCKGSCATEGAAAAKGAEDETAGGCGTANGKSSGGEMAEMEKKLRQDEQATANATEMEVKMPGKPASVGMELEESIDASKNMIPIRTKQEKKGARGQNRGAGAVKQKLGQCERCGYLSSQAICKACVLLEGLNKARPRTEITVTDPAD